MQCTRNGRRVRLKEKKMELFATYPMKKGGWSPSGSGGRGQGFMEISGEQLPPLN